MNAHRSTTLLDVEAEVTNVKQAQSAVMTKAGDEIEAGLVREGIAKRNFLPKVREKARTPRSIAGSAGERPPSVRMPQETKKVAAKESRRVRREETAKAPEKARKCSKANASSSAAQVGAHVERLQVQGDECVQGGRGRACIKEWMRQRVGHRVGCIQVSEESRQTRIGITSRAAVTVYPVLKSPSYAKN